MDEGDLLSFLEEELGPVVFCHLLPQLPEVLMYPSFSWMPFGKEENQCGHV